MIPRQLFLVWINNKIPNHLSNSLKYFKELNPDFNINFIHIEKCENISNNKEVIIRKCFSYIDKILKHDDKKCKYYNFIKKVTNPSYRLKRNFITYFTDIVRFELIESYGGIYLDCDTFPIISFDDNLLKCTQFKSKTNYGHDYFFFGNIKGINSFYNKKWI